MSRILIVDDEKSIRRTLGEFLRAEGYDVEEAEDADAAQRRLSEAAFDVVVTDIILPGLSGVELLRRVHRAAPEVPVVMMTGEPTVETAAEALRLGAADYLPKPITKSAILRVVATAARIKSLGDEKRRLEAENHAHRENLERLVLERTAQLTTSEEHARQLSRFNQYILDSLPANICVLNEQGEILAVNAPWRAFAAANPPSPTNADVGANYLALCEQARGENAALAREVAQGLRAVIQDRAPEYTVEYPCHSPDAQRWFMLRATRFAEAGPVRLVVAHVDITARKLAEQRIADALNFSRTLLESSPIGVVSYQASGEAVSVNAAMAEMLGTPVPEVLAQNFRELESWRRSGLLAAAERALATQTEQQVEVNLGPTLEKRLDLACRFVPFTYAGKPHLLVLAVDVTEQKLTQAKLLRAQRVEGIGSLASGIAHDLNNILTPILMCAAMLPLEDSPKARRDMARTIESSAQRAVSIVRQLLSVARGKEGERRPVQLHHLVRAMVKIARETFPRSIRVEEYCPPDLWLVTADATQLHQVLLNLCVNARDAMPGGGRLILRAENVVLDEAYVSMRKEARPGPYVRLRVEDTGVGIPESAQPHIFDSFFTTKSEGQGTGLGLAIVKGIVLDHKGFIRFETAVGHGTTFEVHLPALVEPQAVDVREAPDDEAPRGQCELVLVVDDEMEVGEASRRSLERHGYRVLLAQDGVDALAKFSTHANEVRAVVTDVMMPLMDGVTLCRGLRALAPGLPLIISSGGLFGEFGNRALEAFQELGIRHIVYKPHTGQVLLKALHEALHGTQVA